MNGLFGDFDGQINGQDIWDYDGDSSDGDDSGCRGPRTKTCNRCGKEKLIWIRTEHGWGLAEIGSRKVHACEPKKLN